MAIALNQTGLTTEWIKGRTVDEALAIKNTEIVEELALPPVKIHCSVLAEDSIRTAIDDAKAKWEKLGAAERDLFSAEELNLMLRYGLDQLVGGAGLVGLHTDSATLDVSVALPTGL